VPPGDSVSETHNYLEKDKSPGSGSSPAKQFLENSRKPKKYTKR